MLYSVLVRRLKEGATYEDFREAWLPDEGFGTSVRVINARSVDNPAEIISIGMVDLPKEELPAALKQIAESEAVRHERIARVIERTVHKGIYEIVDDDDLT
ncbi:MAG: hypothetical protein AAF414_24200 [Pseudomonadota bacterium]